MSISKLRFFILGWVCLFASTASLAQIRFQCIGIQSLDPANQYVEVNLRLQQFAGSRPSAVAPGTSDIIIGYNPQFLNVTNSNITVVARGPWDVATTPQYYEQVQVFKGAGNYVVVRIREKAVPATAGLPNIGRGAINTLVCTFRLPTQPAAQLCGQGSMMGLIANPATACNNRLSRLSTLREFGQNESDPTLNSATEFQFAPASLLFAPTVSPIPATSMATRADLGYFNFSFDDAALAANSRGIRHKITFIPAPQFGCAANAALRFDTVNVNYATAGLPRKTYNFGRVPNVITCNGVAVTKGTIRIVSYTVCGDSTVSAPFNISYETCYPFVFLPGFAAVAPTSRTICKNDPVTITLDTGLVRNQVANTQERVKWAPTPTNFTGRFSFDDGLTWQVSNTRTYPNLWAIGVAGTTIKVKVRDRNVCVSDSFSIRINFNSPVDPASRPSITNKATIPAGVCSANAIRLEGVGLGDQNIPYTWRLATAGGQILDGPAGNPTTTGAVVFYQRPAGFIGLTKIYLENVCYGNLRDSVVINFVSTPNPKIAFVSPGNAEPNVAFLNGPNRMRASAFAANGSSTNYNWTVIQNGVTDVRPVTQDESIPYTFTTIGLATIRLRASSSDGSCSADSLISVDVRNFQDFFVPSIFSPNATDSRNQAFFVQGDNLSNDDFKLIVMNRWGQVVYDSNNVNGRWDGKDTGGKECTMDTYTYAVKGKFLDGKTFQKTGIVNLLK